MNFSVYIIVKLRKISRDDQDDMNAPKISEEKQFRITVLRIEGLRYIGMTE